MIQLHSTKDEPIKKVVSAREVVQTFRYWIKLECGHELRKTRSAKNRWILPKKMRCFYCYKENKNKGGN